MVHAVDYYRDGDKSPPLRGRGLKPSRVDRGRAGRVVAPPAGAWIETAGAAGKAWPALVAPPAGAWIETVNQVQ